MFCQHIGKGRQAFPLVWIQRIPKNSKIYFPFQCWDKEVFFTCLFPSKIIFMFFYSVFLLDLASAGLKIKLQIFRVEHIIHHSWTRLLQPNTEMWEMMQSSHNTILGKFVRDSPERWIFVPMIMPVNYQGPACVLLSLTMVI